jgi:hypothetical protein
MTTVTVDLIDVITVTADPIVAITIGIDVIIAVTTAAMIIAMTALVIGVMIDVARTTTTAMTTTARSALHHDHQKGETPMVHSKQLTERSTSSSAVA